MRAAWRARRADDVERDHQGRAARRAERKAQGAIDAAQQAVLHRPADHPRHQREQDHQHQEAYPVGNDVGDRGVADHLPSWPPQVGEQLHAEHAGTDPGGEPEQLAHETPNQAEQGGQEQDRDRHDVDGVQGTPPSLCDAHIVRTGGSERLRCP